MIEQLFNEPHVLYQQADDESGLPEEAISASVDAGGFIVLSQAGNKYICINKASVRELCQLLRTLAAV